jgi:hypothetical protein
VLEREQSELREGNRIRMTTYTKNTTHRQTTESEARATSCADALRCMIRGIAS